MSRTIDTYYVDPLREDLKPDAGGRLKASFRVREKHGSTSSVAYKVDHFEGGEWLYSDEHETSLTEPKIMRTIIGSLGLQELVRIDNQKHVFETDEYEIVLEEVEELGRFLEVEKKEQVADSDVVATKQQIREFIANLGIELGNEMNAGKPELMLSKKVQ